MGLDRAKSLPDAIGSSDIDHPKAEALQARCKGGGAQPTAGLVVAVETQQKPDSRNMA